MNFFKYLEMVENCNWKKFGNFVNQDIYIEVVKLFKQHVSPTFPKTGFPLLINAELEP